MKLQIDRKFYKETQTESIIKLYDGNDIIFTCLCLELPWKKNKPNISCIPRGLYKATKHISPKFGKTVWIKDVPERSEILIHKGNYLGSNNPKTGTPDSLGCLIIGTHYADFNNDGIYEIANSDFTMNVLYSLLPDTFDVDITYKIDYAVSNS